MQKVNVIIPALNEPYLPELTRKLRDYQVTICEQKGLSYAVHIGLKYSEAKKVVVMDGDGSHPPDSIRHMTKLLNEKVWLVVGSRYCKNGYSHDSLLRKIVSQVYCLLARIILRTKIKDSMSGFWVGYRQVFTFKHSNTFKFGLQLIRKYKHHILEYPIIFRKRQTGKSHVKPLQALKDLCAIFCAG